MSFWLFISIVGVISVTFSYYVYKPNLNTRKKKLFSILIFSFTALTYLSNANLEIFSYKETLEDDLYNEKKINPEKLILYLEIQLKENPNDLEGWKILAKTCLLTGYVQKADLYFKKSLKIFPDNLDLLLEYADLKENIFESSNAIILREKIKKIDGSNIENVISLTRLYIAKGKKNKAINAIKFLENKKINESIINELNSKMNF